MGAVDSLIKVIDKCEGLRTLRMSHLEFNEEACDRFIDGLRHLITRKWGLLCNLQLLEWEEQLFEHSQTINHKTVHERLSNLYNSELVINDHCDHHAKLATNHPDCSSSEQLAGM